MSVSHDKYATRLALIIRKLHNQERPSDDELAEEFNISPRTIRRDMNERLSFLPIKKENGRYMLEGYALGNLSFDDLKNFAAISGIKSLYPTLSNEFISDLLNMKINHTYQINAFGFEKINDRTKEFQKLNVAILHNQTLTFKYNGKPRSVKPYKLINNNGIWYLAGDEDAKIKMYTLQKVQDLCILDKTFKVDKKTLEKIDKNEANWFSEETIEVILEIDKPLIEYYLRRDILPNQTILKQSEEKLTLMTKVTYENEILNIVKHALPHVKISSPTYLQEKLEDILQTYLKRS
ncbi:WYL domain-containing protein [Sulfurimonas lithotrophica]|uniref:WYL domain-containing protein n=1 Tax=Sulfurimonas lithotrophica TaxID=2590022 RepID=A0A5P8P130_9BACT|nr:WYL domain-containing protein [Sulfurimonas lithotrophica]QFR49389.1 WYL domain-containing protein [Sulfurimonas lithotrophica]